MRAVEDFAGDDDHAVHKVGPDLGPVDGEGALLPGRQNAFAEQVCCEVVFRWGNPQHAADNVKRKQTCEGFSKAEARANSIS